MDKSIHSPDYNQLRAMLRQIRKEAGLTQVQVAGRLGKPQSFVSKYESGERRLDVIELRKVAVVLGTSATHVVEEWERATGHRPQS